MKLTLAHGLLGAAMAASAFTVPATAATAATADSAAPARLATVQSAKQSVGPAAVTPARLDAQFASDAPAARRGASRNFVSGEDLIVYVTPPVRKGIKTVLLQKKVGSTWKNVDSMRGDGRAKYTMAYTLTGIGKQTYRGLVKYKNGKQAKTDALAVMVYDWIPLADIPTGAVSNMEQDASFAVGGVLASGWALAGTAQVGYLDLNLSGHCYGVVAALGATDESDTDSAAQFRFAPPTSTSGFYSDLMTPGQRVVESVTTEGFAVLRVEASSLNDSPHDGDDNAQHAVAVMMEGEALCKSRF